MVMYSNNGAADLLRGFNGMSTCKRILVALLSICFYRNVICMIYLNFMAFS